MTSIMVDYPATSDRSRGWLRYLYRKATTPNDWDKNGKPHDHWDNLTDLAICVRVGNCVCRESAMALGVDVAEGVRVRLVQPTITRSPVHRIAASSPGSMIILHPLVA